MPRLIVMRHAKAVDRMEAEDDFERGLTERGRTDAARAAEVFRAHGFRPERALVSPSRRTRETFAQVREALGDPPAEDPMALYHASTSMLQRAVAEAVADGADQLIVIAHNPGVGGFAHGLAADAGAATQMPRGWPTSAAGAFEINAGAAPGSVRASAVLFLFDPKA